MKKYRVKIEIRLKPGILDAEGRAIEKAIERFGVNAQNTRKGKIIEFELYAKEREEVESQVKSLTEKLLINPLTEEYNLKISDE